MPSFWRGRAAKGTNQLLWRDLVLPISWSLPEGTARIVLGLGIGALIISLGLTVLNADQLTRTFGLSLATAFILAGVFSLTHGAMDRLDKNEAGADASATTEAVDREANRVAPLPFIGERILLNPESGDQISKLAQATARLGRRSVVRSHPWGELMARVSHELRTPLNAVIGFSDMMTAEMLGPLGHPRYREYLQHIRDGGRDLLKSAEDTLAMTALLEGEKSEAQAQVHDLSAMVHECWGFYRDLIEVRRIGLGTDIPEDVALAMERRVLRQILINLIAEALSRTEDGGTIGISVRRDNDLVQIEVFVHGAPAGDQTIEPSLAICLARALLELQGAALVEVNDLSCAWRTLTVLRGLSQDDFFSLPVPQAEAPSVHLN